MVTKMGLIGLSEGNGHPYSWGSIINGFDESSFRVSNWEVIYNYVKKRDISEFGFNDVKITHVWTQDDKLSCNLAKTIKAEYVVENYLDMIGEVDAVIIARDDYENHLKMSKSFLEAGVKVLIDKPLTIDIQELKFFKQYLKKGQLMSVAGLRFAAELDDIKADIEDFGELKVIQSSVIMNWEKYGIHIIDGVLGIIKEKPSYIEFVPETSLYVIRFKSGLVWTINILGITEKTFNIEIWGNKKRQSAEITDNFTMFRRMLFRFIKLVKEDEILCNAEETLVAIALLIGGKMSREENRRIDMETLYKKLGMGESE